MSEDTKIIKKQQLFTFFEILQNVASWLLLLADFMLSEIIDIWLVSIFFISLISLKYHIFS